MSDRRSVQVTPQVSIRLDSDEVLRVNDYRILSTIGRGAFSEVVLAESDGKNFAIKWLDRVKLARQGAFVTAATPGSTARSPLQLVANDVVATGTTMLPTSVTVPALEVIGDGGRDLFIVQEYAEAGAIMVPLDEEKGTYLASFGGVPSPLAPAPPSDPASSDEQPAQSYEEGIARVIFRSLLIALRECHARGVAHRDVKPDNIVASADGRVRLTDFSSSYLFDRPGHGQEPRGLLVKAIDALVTGEEDGGLGSTATGRGRHSVSVPKRSDREIRQIHALQPEHSEATAAAGSGAAAAKQAAAPASPSTTSAQGTTASVEARVDNFDATPRPPAPGTKPPKPAGAPEGLEATGAAEGGGTEQAEVAELAASGAGKSLGPVETVPEAAAAAGGSFSGSTEVTDTQGTPAFFPPEACTSLDASRPAGSEIRFDAFKQDAWAAGVTLYCLLFGQHPFASEDTPTADELFSRIARRAVDLPRRSSDGEAAELLEVPLDGRGADGIREAEAAAMRAHGAADEDVEKVLRDDSRRFVSPPAEDLLVRLLAADPLGRLGVAEALQHPWLQEDADRQFTECPAIDLEALEPYESLLMDQLKEDKARGGSGVLTAAGKSGLPAAELGDVVAAGSKAASEMAAAEAAEAGAPGAAASGAGGASNGDAEEAGAGGSTAVVREPARLVDRGYLAKRGRILKSWKQRWILVRGDTLFYFPDEVPDADELSHHELALRSSGESLSLDGPTYVSPQPKPAKPYRFCVEVEGRQLYLQAADQADLDAWIDSIRYWAAKARAEAHAGEGAGGES